MQRKRQFQTAAQRRLFFDRKVLKYGHSRSLSLGKILPKDWDYVRIRIIEQTDNHLTLSLDLLWRDTNNARCPQINPPSRYDT